MKTFLLFIATCFSSNIVLAQSKVSDSLLNEICRTIKSSNDTNDSMKVLSAFYQHLHNILEQMDDSSKVETMNNSFYRLQRSCIEFKRILDRLDKPKGDWQIVTTNPVSQLQKDDCRQISNYQLLYYLEANGDTTIITIKNGFWIDHFKDGTYSKLKLSWTSDCEFEIAFIESNNLVRKNFSRPGDKYYYRLIDKHEEYYTASVEIRESGQIATFRIYYR